ncbi:MAG: serine/threonine-protein kinase [Myxococcota bacterium]
MVELCNEGVFVHARLQELMSDLESVITLSEGPVQDSLEVPLHLVSELGRGAMGFVHAARDSTLGRNVAVKKMDPKAVHNDVMLGRFKAEAQITAQLDHPGIVPVYALSSDRNGVPSYSMKLIRGRTLTAWLTACGAQYGRGNKPDDEHDLTSRLDVFVQICNAVAYAHSRGVLHRDLKPDNIMLGAFHEVLVVDWGVAKLIGATEGTLEGLPSSTAGEGTEIGTVVGTPQYCSPEQARGENDQLDASSDQYALGLMLFEMVSLTRALRGKTSYMVLMKASNGDVPPMVHAHSERIPRQLFGIVRKATRLAPQDRFESVEELADDVRRFLRDEPVLASPDSWAQTVGRSVARHRQATLSIIGLLLASLFAVALIAVVGVMAAAEVSERAAEERERHVIVALTAARQQASIIDAELFNTEALVTGLGGAAAEALTRTPQTSLPVYLATTFGEPEGPPDQVQSAHYGAVISMEHPDLHVPQSVPLLLVREQLQQLVGLMPQLRLALLRSENPALARRPWEGVRQRVLDEGLIATWTYVATEQGVLAGYPGVGGYSLDLDPRTRPWYRVGADGNGPQWSALSVEESDPGLLLTCTLAIRDAQGERLGVAAADLAFGAFIERYLDPTDLSIPAEAWLVDSNDRVVVRSEQKATARTMTTYSPVPFPMTEVLAQMDRHPAGQVVTEVEGESMLFVWTPMLAVPWTYVLQIREADLASL